MRTFLESGTAWRGKIGNARVKDYADAAMPHHRNNEYLSLSVDLMESSLIMNN